MKRWLILIGGTVSLAYYGAVTIHADNPCVQQWGWTGLTDPVLTLSAPQNMPATCVGQITVNGYAPTATAGTKRWVDMNGCPNSPQYDPVSMPITPVNTWSLYLYPPGTTPTSGSGTTATFTTVQGGTVVVQFETRATVSDPAWDSGPVAAQTNPFKVFEVASLTISGNGGIYEFDDGDNNPSTTLYLVHWGLGTVCVDAAPNPSVQSESELPSCWSFSGGQALGQGKLHRYLNRQYPGKYVFSAQSGTSTKQMTVIVYQAEFRLKADSGGQNDPQVGHSWWELYVNSAAKIPAVLPGALASYADEAGYWPDDWTVMPPLKVSGPGDVMLGAQGHSADGYYAWDVNIFTLISGTQSVRDFDNNPGTFNLYTHNCTHAAKDVASEVDSIVISSGIWTPWVLSAYLRTLTPELPPIW
jgi:hypothetical protein